MPGLGDPLVVNPIKMLLIGDSGGGKTGALASLAKAGYKLRILDCDNGLEILRQVLKKEAPQCLGTHPSGEPWVHYVPCFEPMKAVAGRAMTERAAAWAKAMNTLSRWKDGETDLGVPSSWDADTVVVVDSLTFLCKYAMNVILEINRRLNETPWQSDWGQAQNLVEGALSLLYSGGFRPNVVVNCHITYIGREIEGLNEKGEVVKREEDVKAYPMSLGRALSPKIGTYFNHALMAQSQGSGPATKRMLYTNTQGLVQLKTPAPGIVKYQYPIETGLADYFETIRGGRPKL
jgi:hypothetical protein